MEYSVVEHKGWRFLLTATPNDKSIKKSIADFQKENVHHIVRCCEPTYKTKKLQTAGITVHEFEFVDGGVPPNDLVKRFLDLCEQTFATGGGETIAIHCIAGLGRTPYLVAVALIEHGMSYQEAVQLIRQHRTGALNMVQINALKHYKKTRGKSRCTIV